MIRTALFEFLSRGLLWGRILIISLFMPADLYGYLILLISAEALFGSVISYPQIKDLLLRQDVHPREISRSFALYVLMLPVIIIASWFYFHSLVAIFAISLGVLFFALSQVLLYSLRISDVCVYNVSKIRAAIFSTVVFMAVLRVAPNLLPIVSGSYAAVLLCSYHRIYPLRLIRLSERFDIADAAGNWAIFGVQSAITNLSMYGNRFIIGISLSLVDVAMFAKSYMIASGVTFYYAAILIYYEKHLSKELDLQFLSERFKLAIKVAAMLVLGLLVYTGLVILAWQYSPSSLAQKFFSGLDRAVYRSFILFFALQIIYLCLNPIVIALGRRGFSLFASTSSLLVQIGLIAFYWPNLNLATIASIMVAGQFSLVAVLIFASKWRLK